MAKGFKVKTKTKGKRWKKGHSSDSNPKENKFRNEAAKFLGLGAVKAKTGGLTEEAVARHDADSDTITKTFSLASLSDDGQSLGGLSWATQATSISFKKLKNFWSHNDAFHKEVLAVYAAVTEIIAERSDNPTETAYFAALITFVETAVSARQETQSKNNEESKESVEEVSLTAAVFLLHLVTKRVPRPVLRASFGTVSKVISAILEEQSGSADLLKGTLVVLAHCLRALDAATWLESSTKRVYQLLLAYSVHPKPKVRKVAQRGVQIVLTTDLGLNQSAAAQHVYHPGAAMTGEHLQAQLVGHLGDDEPQILLHTLGLAGRVMGHIPPKHVKTLCESLLGLMKMSHTLLRTVSMQTFHQLFSNQQCPLAASNVSQLITALYVYQPSEDDTPLMNSWIAMMEKGLLSLAKLDASLCLKHLPHFFKACMKALRNESSGSMVSQALSSMIQKIMVSSVSAPSELPVSELLTSLKQGLGYQYQATWPRVLQVTELLFKDLGSVCKQQCGPLSKQCLQTLTELRESPYFPAKNGIDKVIGRAVGSMGPAFVLEAIPLNITGTDEDDVDFPRGWLLPVLRDHISHTEVAHFLTWLPLAAKLHQKAQSKNKMEAKTYGILENQVWSLLPGYCSHPTDLTQSFPAIVSVIGPALTQRADIRPLIMAAVRKLVAYCLENEAEKVAIQQYARKFIPTLFKIFTDESKEAAETRSKKHLAVLETIKAFIKISETALVETYYSQCLEKLKQDQTSPALFDLAIALASQVEDEEKFNNLFGFIKSLLASKDRIVQKKAYRILEVMCCSDSPACVKFVGQNLPGVSSTLLKNLAKSSPASKLPRLRCLKVIFEKLKKPNMDFLKRALPEAMLCFNINNVRVQVAAQQLLLAISDKFALWQTPKPDHPLDKFIELVMAGLAGSTAMKVATLLALRQLVKEKKGGIPHQPLLSTCLEHLQTDDLEVSAGALLLMKTCLGCFKTEEIASVVQPLVAALCRIKHGNKKKVFTKLLQKFGYTTLLPMVNDKKNRIVLKNLEKQRRKSSQKKEKPEEKPKKMEKMETEEDDFSSDESEAAPAPKTGAFLKEEETPLDFMAPLSVSSKVLSTKPANRKRKATWDRVAPDGRLIVEEEEEPDTKRQATSVDEMDDDIDDDDDKDKKVYKPGGKGLHRKLKTKGKVIGVKRGVKSAHRRFSQKTRDDHGNKVQPYEYIPLTR